MKIQKAKKQKRGFTLIEVLVSTVIFSIIVGAAIGVFTSGLKSQRKILANQEILSQASYVMEYMSKALRMAKKDIDGECIDVGSNYASDAEGIEFMNYSGDCQKFYISGVQLKEVKNGNNELELTSPGLQVSDFGINLVGNSQTDDFQPAVALFLEVEGKEDTKIQLQTTISQRDLDFPY